MATPNAFFDQWSQFAKFPLYEPLIEFNVITTRICGEIMRENIKAMNEMMEQNAEQLQHLSHSKNPAGLLEMQSKLAMDMGPKMFQHAQHILDTMLQGAAEYREWMEKGSQKFTKQAHNVAEQTVHEYKQVHRAAEKVAEKAVHEYKPHHRK